MAFRSAEATSAVDVLRKLSCGTSVSNVIAKVLGANGGMNGGGSVGGDGGGGE